MESVHSVNAMTRCSRSGLMSAVSLVKGVRRSLPEVPGLMAMSITGSSDSRNRAPIAARHRGSRRAAFSHSKKICCDVSGDIGFEFLKSSANYSLNYSLYYSVEVFFMGGRNLSSYPLGSFLHTSTRPQR